MTVVRQFIANLPSLDIEQKILCDEFFKRFDFGAGAAFDVVNVEPLLYEGIIGGSEFTVYNANKLYLCFDILLNYSAGASAILASVQFFNEVNATIFYSQNNSIAYEAVAAAIWYQKNNMNIKNCYFSRIAQLSYNYMKFIGYRITY